VEENCGKCSRAKITKTYQQALYECCALPPIYLNGNYIRPVVEQNDPACIYFDEKEQQSRFKVSGGWVYSEKAGFVHTDPEWSPSDTGSKY
jgi:hypothetical protein